MSRDKGGYHCGSIRMPHGTHEEYLVALGRVPHVPMKNTLWLWGGYRMYPRRIPCGSGEGTSCTHEEYLVALGRVPHVPKKNTLNTLWLWGGYLMVLGKVACIYREGASCTYEEYLVAPRGNLVVSERASCNHEEYLMVLGRVPSGLRFQDTLLF